MTMRPTKSGSPSGVAVPEAEAVLLPNWLTPRTRNVYSVPPTRSAGVAALVCVALYDVSVPPVVRQLVPSSLLYSYRLRVPPFAAPAVQLNETARSPAVALKPVGAPGSPPGVAVPEAEAVLLPNWLTPRTRNVYSVPPTRSAGVAALVCVALYDVSVPPVVRQLVPSSLLYSYRLRVPPFAAPAVQLNETARSPAVALKPVGAPGSPPGVAVPEAEAVLLPNWLTPRTRNVYSVPPTRSAGVAALVCVALYDVSVPPVVRQVVPSSLLYSYRLRVPPFSAPAVQLNETARSPAVALKPVGAPGSPPGVAVAGPEDDPVSTSLTALTQNWC